MSQVLNFGDFSDNEKLDIREAKNLVISANAVNEQNRLIAENSIKALKQVAAKITVEVRQRFMERGIDLSDLADTNWDLLISSEEYRTEFLRNHYNTLDLLVKHIKSEMGHL